MIRDAKKGQRFNSEFQLILNCDRVDVSSCLRAANFRPEECLDIHNQVRTLMFVLLGESLSIRSKPTILPAYIYIHCELLFPHWRGK